MNIRAAGSILIAPLLCISALAADARPGWLGLGYANHPRMKDGKFVGSWFYVLHVLPGGAAARAGVQRGDVITAIDGRPLRHASDRDAFMAMSRIRPGQKLRLSIARGDRRLNLTAVAAEMPDEIWNMWQKNKALLDRAKSPH